MITWEVGLAVLAALVAGWFLRGTKLQLPQLPTIIKHNPKRTTVKPPPSVDPVVEPPSSEFLDELHERVKKL